MRHPAISTGLEHLKQQPDLLPGKGRIGLLANPASVDTAFTHASRIIHGLYPGRLTALFSPQHGFYAEKQDNMIESDHAVDPVLHIPIFSLYSETRIPSPEMMDHVDLLLIDLQDVGTRVYTFMYTMSYCLEAAARTGKKVVILDRPNPLGGVAVEGNRLKMSCRSFVGRYPLPMRHGLTMGELALLFNQKYGIHADVTVIPMKGWQRQMYYPHTGLAWVAPSPNLPTPASALVYPGQVIFEGTNVSEGRGTTQPFECVGAPFIDPGPMEKELRDTLPGVILRPICFEPTSGKWAGTPCRGFQLHVTHAGAFRPFRTALALLQQFCRHHPFAVKWKTPPYEYEYHIPPMDLILGHPDLKECIRDQVPLDDLEASWQQGLKEFAEEKRAYHLYD